MPSPLTIDTVILIRLATVQQADLHRLLSQAWRMIAPARLLTRVETCRNLTTPAMSTFQPCSVYD